MPFLLIFIFLTNLFLIKGIYLIFLLLQICFYSMAFYGYLLKKKGSQVGSVLYIPLYYCTMNLAAILGFYYFLKQERGVNIWKKAAR
jgi:FtsH-binding integral membrane protein